MENLENGWTGPTDAHGVQCASWSINMADQWSGLVNADDLAEQEYMYNQGIDSEADRNGITSPTTGTSRLP